MPARHLRLYTDAAAPTRPDEITLREAFDQFLLPTLERSGRSPAHITAHRTAINHWERLTPNPPVVEIDDDALQVFADKLLAWYLSQDKRGKTATENNLGYVRFILRACCPRGHSNKRGQPGGKHLIDDLPIAHTPGKDQAKKRVAHLCEISAAYEAIGDVVTWPRSRRRSLWDRPIELWRLLWCLDYNFGPRTEELLALSWESVHWDTPCPSPVISRLDWQYGWLEYTPTKTSRHKPEPLYLPLTECARLHLDMMRPSKTPSGPIFDFPKNKRARYATLEAIWTAAGVERPYTFQEMRKTCSTYWNDLWPDLGEHVVGHAARGVNAKHYDSDLRRLCQHAPRLPQPEAMLKAVGLDPSKHKSARAALAERLGQLSEDQAQLILQIADNMAG